MSTVISAYGGLERIHHGELTRSPFGLLVAWARRVLRFRSVVNGLGLVLRT